MRPSPDGCGGSGQAWITFARVSLTTRLPQTDFPRRTARWVWVSPPQFTVNSTVWRAASMTRTVLPGCQSRPVYRLHPFWLPLRRYNEASAGSSHLKRACAQSIGASQADHTRLPNRLAPNAKATHTRDATDGCHRRTYRSKGRTPRPERTYLHSVSRGRAASFLGRPCALFRKMISCVNLGGVGRRDEGRAQPGIVHGYLVRTRKTTVQKCHHACIAYCVTGRSKNDSNQSGAVVYSGGHQIEPRGAGEARLHAISAWVSSKQGS